jgi:hypothetical protein
MANIAVRTGKHRLVWNEEKGKFNGARDANQFIKPEYRNPWSFPNL